MEPKNIKNHQKREVWNKMRVDIIKGVVRRVITLVALASIALIAGVFITNDVNADANEGGGPSGGGVACGDNYFLCTRYGAEWRLYKAESDSIEIPGIGKDYAAGTTVTGCKSNGGYYWRYGMVAARDGYGYEAGRQVGVTSIGGEYGSAEFGGIMHNMNPENWGKAMADYAKWQAVFPDQLQKGFNRNSDLSWFCAGNEFAQTEDHGDSCAEWKPADVDSGYNHVMTAVRNPRLSMAFSGWRQVEEDNGLDEKTEKITYAMPTDNIEWKICYWAGAERNKNKDINEVNGQLVEGAADPLYLPQRKHKEKESTCGDGGFKYGKFKDVKEPLWPSKFNYTVLTDTGGVIDSVGVEKVVEIGGGKDVDFDKDVEISDKYTVTIDDPSHTYHDQITLPPDDYSNIQASKQATFDREEKHEWECEAGYDEYGPYYKPQKHDPYKIGTFKLNGGELKSAAYVKVPYNFSAEVEIEIDKSGRLFSGTTFVVESTTARIKPKPNFLTENSYATKLDTDATIRAFAYVAGEDNTIGISSDAECLNSWLKQCDELPGSPYTWNKPNEGGNLRGDALSKFPWNGQTLGAYDAPAGQFLCVIAAMTPLSSGADDNLSTGNFNKSWYISNPSCKMIFKKPFFQVWGGDMYSKGDVKSNVTNKGNIYTEKFNFSNTSGNYFSSWVEEGLIIKDGKTGIFGTEDHTMASGVVTGFRADSNYEKAGKKSDYSLCDTSPLTLANIDCERGNVGGFGATPLSTVDREELIKYWLGIEEEDTYHISITDLDFSSSNSDKEFRVIKSGTGRDIKYIDSDNNINIKGRLPSNSTYLIKTKGDITITDDITYYDKTNETTYSSRWDIPKLIIFAQNIKIHCNVNRVDAIILTRSGGEVDTCSDGGSTEKQLRIFGMVATDKIHLKRTFGGAAWDGGESVTVLPSGERKKVTTDGLAAEVFDYDATIPMWSEYMSGSAETDTLQVVYQHELAPRY